MHADYFASPATVREWLEHAPADPGPRAPGLKGFRIAGRFYCSHCCGRLAQRAILLPGASLPVWDDQGNAWTCDACGRIAAGVLISAASQH